jgi:hypothetical protein
LKSLIKILIHIALLKSVLKRQRNLSSPVP